MNTERPIKLSVCIATYNRARFIGETLRSIIGQAEDDIEIVVLDGGSSDNTESIVKDYQEQFERLHYVRQQINFGIDRDFDSAVNLARGEYCWLMSDDDFVRPGAMAAVLEATRNGYSLIVVNAEVRNADMSMVLQRRRLKISEDELYKPWEMDRLFAEVGDYLTFIGCVVIRRSIWAERERAHYFGSLFIHVGVIFQSALPGDALVIAEPLVSIRYGNAMWRPLQFEIWMFRWPSLVWMLGGPSADAKKVVCRAEPWRSLKALALYRARGSYSLDEYRKWLRPRLCSRWKRLVALILAVIPGIALNLLALLYYRIARGERGMGLLDMRNSRFHYRNWRLLTPRP